MQLPNELTHDKAASFALSRSITWRSLVVVFLVGSLSQLVPVEFRFDNTWLFLIASILMTFLLMWLWIHRILRRGIGRVKIIFMEQAHYEALHQRVNGS